MSYSIRKKDITDFFFPAVIASVLFLTAVYLQVVGFFFSIFSPLPIIFIYLHRGKRAGLNILFAVTVIICLIGNLKYGGIYFLEYGVMAIIIGEAVTRHYSIEKTILLSVFMSLLAGSLLLAGFFVIKGDNPYLLFFEQLDMNMEASLARYQESGVTQENIEILKEYSKKIKKLFVSSFPAWIVVGAIVGSLLNYIAIRTLWKKYKKNEYFKNGTLSCWATPDYFVWILIFSGGMLIPPLPLLNVIGLNLLIVTLLIYFFQGFAILYHYAIKVKIPKIFKIICFFMIFTQLAMVVVTICFGIFDLWFDFRKLRVQEK